MHFRIGLDQTYGRYTAWGIVFSEYVLRGLLVVLVHPGAVLFSLFRQRMCCSAIATLVGLL